MFQKYVKLVAIVCCCSSEGLFAHAANAESASPRYVPFQARLTDTAGAALPDNVYSIAFNIYDQPTGGTSCWTESHSSVSVIGGQVNVLLGSLTFLDDPNKDGSPADSLNLDPQFQNCGSLGQPTCKPCQAKGDRYLGITVGAAAQEMVPRHQLIPAFHARTAGTANAVVAGGITSTMIADGAVTTTKIPDGSLTGAKIEDKSLGGAKLADAAITSLKIAPGAVTSAALAPGSVGPAALAEGGGSIKNYSISAGVSGGSLNIALKTRAGLDPSPADGVFLSFRSPTLAAGDSTVVTTTVPTTLTISAGSTLGHSSSKEGFIYVYALNNAGAVELAATMKPIDEKNPASTTAEGGAGQADSGLTLYSTVPRANKPVRLLAILKSTQPTAGIWSAAIAQISLTNFEYETYGNDEIYVYGMTGFGSVNTRIVRWSTVQTNTGDAMTLTQSATVGDHITINRPGLYSVSTQSMPVNAVSAGMGASVNAPALSTSLGEAVNAPYALFYNFDAVAATSYSVGGGSRILRLNPGDVVRGHTISSSGSLSDFFNHPSNPIANHMRVVLIGP